MGTTPKPRWDSSRRRWYFNVSGRRYTRVRRGDAYELLAKLMRDRPLTFDDPVNVAELAEAYKRWKADAWTRRMLKDWIGLAGALPLDRLDKKTLVLLRDELLAAGQSPRTVRHKVGTAYRCLQWGLENGYLDTLPRKPRTPQIKANPRDVPVPVLLDGLARLGGRAKALATMILLTGCRPSEARLARWEEFDIDNARWHLQRSKTGPGRTVELTDEAVQFLRDQRPCQSGYVFPSRTGKPYTRSGFGCLCRRVGFSQYQLRHTFAQNAFDQGVDAAIVAQLLGHKGLDTVLVYMQVRRQRVRDAVRSLVSPLMRARDAQSEPTASLPEPPIEPLKTERQTPSKNATRRRAL